MTPKMPGNELRRQAAHFREIGTFVSFRKNRKSRTVSIEYGAGSDDADYSSATG